MDQIQGTISDDRECGSSVGHLVNGVGCQESKVTSRITEGDDNSCDGSCGGPSIGTGGATSMIMTRINTVTMLGDQQIGLKRSCARAFWSSLGSLPFHKNQDMDLYGDEVELEQQGLERERSTIIDIIAIEDIVIVRSVRGLAAAFCRVTNKLLAFLNASSTESIESLFYNKYRESLLIVSTDEPSGYRSPIFRELTIRCILRKSLDHGYLIFKNENLSYPGFLDVDNTNELVLIKNNRMCRIFDLKNYLFKYEFCATNVYSVLYRPQVLLVNYVADGGRLPLELKLISAETGETLIRLPLKLKSAETGETLTSLNYNISGGERIKCLDMINGKLLIKQAYRNLQVVDLMSSKLVEVEIGDCLLVPLPGRNAFISFQQDSTEIRDTDGNIIRSIDGHVLYNINSVVLNVWVSRREDMIISVCRSEGETVESVRITSIDSGRVLSTMDPKTKVTAMSYNDDLKELYIGTASGRVLVWSI